MTISIQDQIKCVGREIGMRRGVYPKWVEQGRKTQAEADAEIEAMEAAYATLKWVGVRATVSFVLPKTKGVVKK